MFKNSMRLEFLSKSQNVSLARVAVAAFVSDIDPTLDEIEDVKVIISEVVTNAIIHGYDDNEDGIIVLEANLEGKELTLKVEDKGNGIEDIDLAMTPFYSSRADLEHAGMGFMFMQSFSNFLKVNSNVGEGTSVIIKKVFESVS